MIISKIAVTNYRGIKNRQIIPLLNLSSFVGKNDAGKSIILNAIASFLDTKNYPVTESDFNNEYQEIEIICHFKDNDLRELIESKVKSKIKKSDGLDELIDDIVFEDELIFRRATNKAGKSFGIEEILIKDFGDEDFSFLYGKNDEELSKTIEKHSITIPIAGTGRNSKLEKIKYIKEFAVKNGIKVIERFITDEFKLGSILPEVELFVSDYGLKADTTFKTTSVSELKNYFDEETSDSTKKLKQVELEIEAQMQSEAQSIKTYMNDYASSLQEVKIEPTISWKDAIKSVDVSFKFDGDEKLIPMSHKGTGYRRLFMVARFRYLAEKEKGHNMIFLIEEPETFLHPSAQEDLLQALDELSSDNQIIITTHSPIFAGATNIESIILCQKQDQSKYLNVADYGDKNEFIFNIIEDLGIKPAYNLRDTHEKILFVESKNDAIFYNFVTKKVLGINLLNNPKILVLPFGGGEDIESFINIDHFSRSGRDLYLIIDSDKHVGNEIKQSNRVKSFCDRNLKNSGYILKKSCIENYYHPRAFERLYGLSENTFDYLDDDANARNTIKEKIAENGLEGKQIKEKNNIYVFEEMTEEEWNEIIEQELIDFLKQIIK